VRAIVEKLDLQEPGDVPEMQPLVAEIHGALQLLRIESPLLGAAHAATPPLRLDSPGDTRRGSGG
jgi:hypothetical protein